MLKIFLFIICIIVSIPIFLGILVHVFKIERNTGDGDVFYDQGRPYESVYLRNGMCYIRFLD